MSSVSLVIPVQDEAHSVATLVESIREQAVQPDEIVFVDAGSTDATVAEIERVKGSLPIQIVPEARIHPGTARNRGVERTSGEWIAFTDGGIELDPQWLAELTAQAGQAEVVLGRVDPVCDSAFRRCAAIAYVPRLDPAGVRGPSIAASMVRRTAFLRVGGFPPHRAAEDLVFLDRLRKANTVFTVAPHAIVHWQLAGSPAATFRRFALYSKHNLIAGWERHWHWGVARLYAALFMAFALAVPVTGAVWALALVPAFFLARAGRAAWTKRACLPFRTLHPLRIVGAAGVLAILDVATLAGFLAWLGEARVRNR